MFCGCSFRAFVRAFLVLCLSLAATESVGIGTAEAAATSAIEKRYVSDAALRKLLGSPTGNEFSVASGRAKHYKWGSLYWTSSTGVHEVHGAIRSRYNELGGPSGRLGFPTTDEGRLSGKYDDPTMPASGARNDFQKGALIWTSGPKAIWISKPFAEALPYSSYPYWSFPTTDERAAGGDSQMVDASVLMYQTPKGFFQVFSGIWYEHPIYSKYRSLGIDRGILGVPTSNRQYIEAGPNGLRAGSYQSFKGGRIYSCGNEHDYWCNGGPEAANAYVVRGAILSKFNDIGGVAALGYPTSEEQDTLGGRVSYFERGWIFWSSSTKKATVYYY